MSSDSNINCLIIFAKSPDARHVKTRLKGFLSDEERLNLYTQLLDSTVKKMKNLKNTDIYIFYTPENAPGFFKRYNIPLYPQYGKDLGERMFNAIKLVLERGYKKAVLIGVDIPEIKEYHIDKAFNELDHSDIVFGPATDGGYYLVGMSKLVEEIFFNIPWSTENTLRESIKRAETNGHNISLIDKLSDIDTINDYKRFFNKHQGDYHGRKGN